MTLAGDGEIVDIFQVPLDTTSVLANSANQLVDSTFTDILLEAKQALRDANSAIEAVSNFTSSITFDEVEGLGFLDGIDIPEFPSAPTRPEIDFGNIDTPVISIPNIPDGSFAYVDATYTSTLLERIKTNLLYIMVNGGTGLGEAYETALWDRSKDRIRDEHALRRARGLEAFANAGWAIPGGALLSHLETIENERDRQIDQITADITVKQAEWGRDLYKWAHEQGVAVEKLTSDNFNTRQARLLEAARSLSEALTREFEYQVKKAELLLFKFKTESDVIQTKAKVKSEVYVAQVTGYKAEVDAIAEGVKAEAEVLTATSRYNAAMADVMVKQAEAKMQGQANEYALRVEQLKSVANVYTQIAAALHSAINVGASISDGLSRGVSESHNFSQSLSNTATISEGWTHTITE